MSKAIHFLKLSLEERNVVLLVIKCYKLTMRNFNFGRKHAPVPFARLLRFLLGWHLLGVCIYKFKLQPAVKKKTEEAGYNWDELTSGL